jgi:hypothetical protein
VSVAAPSSAYVPTGAPVDDPLDVGAVCPLCGSSLDPTQDWCLRCGAAARTRLAATPRWKGLVLLLAIVAVLALGVLAAALVKLAGDTGSSSVPSSVRSLASPAGALSAPSTTAAPSGGSAATTPASAAPSATTAGTRAGTAGAAAPASTVPQAGATTTTTPARSPAIGGAGFRPGAGALRPGAAPGRTGG